MRRFVFILLLLATSVGTAVAQQQAVVDMADDPTHTLLLANAYLRAFAVELPRLGKTRLHRHDHDYIVVSLTENENEQEDAGSHPITYSHEAEDVTYVHRARFAHTLRNPRIMPYRDLTIEIMRRDESAYSGYIPADVDTFILTWGTDREQPFVVAVDKTGVTMVRVQLLANGTVQRPGRGAGTLLVALTDVRLQPVGAKDEDPPLTLGKGDIKWIEGGAVALRNADKEPARFLLLEFNAN